MAVSIDSIKSEISHRGGLAKSNRYGVWIFHPVMFSEDYDPATGLGDWLTNNGRNSKEEMGSVESILLLCNTCSIPGRRILTTESTHNHNLSKKPYSVMTEEVTMTFLLTNDYYIKKYFDKWQDMIIDSSHEHYKAFYKRDYVTDVYIEQLTSNDLTSYEVKLENAYPIQVSSIELGNANEGVLEVSVTWEYDNWRALKEKIDDHPTDKKMLSELDEIKKRMAFVPPTNQNKGPGFLSNINQPRTNNERQTYTIVKEEVRGPWTKRPGPWNNFLR
jgi:hypothetical protein